MLVRFLVKNLFSFKELTSLDMLPGRSTRMSHHLYHVAGIELLKLNAMYGANGAGKSNLIKSLSLLKDFVDTGEMPSEFLTQTFRFDKESKNKEVFLGVEFIKDNVPYYYGITLLDGVIVEEELIISGLGKKEDYTLFIRKDKGVEEQPDIVFSQEVVSNADTAPFAGFLKNEVLERNIPVLFHMASRKHEVFKPFKKALEWFTEDLSPIMPSSRPTGLALELEDNKDFLDFATEAMRSFHTGINSFQVDKMPIEDFFGEDSRNEMDKVISDLKANPKRIRFLRTKHEEVFFILEDGKVFAKRLYFIHKTEEGVAKFTADEESDGTKRLLDYLPAFFAAVRLKSVYLIDEIERSLHPLLIKELISKFSNDENTKGQLIFSTHESNLLDQEIFRPDEIWFAEKNTTGATEVYSLNEFKEHHTLDIRKGYLNGRYGGIPFLANLKDLNWEKYAETV